MYTSPTATFPRLSGVGTSPLPFNSLNPIAQAFAGDTYYHRQLGMVKYRASWMPDDPGMQVGQTLGLMGRRAGEDAAALRERARQIAGTGTRLDQISKLYWHTKNGIRFQRDEVTGGGVGGFSEEEVIETIIRPKEMAGFIDAGSAVGDCDDFSMYLACLLSAVGIPCEFVTVAADGRVPDQYSHVYVAAFDEEGNRIPLDASHGDYPGWEVPNQFDLIKSWPVSGCGFLCNVLASMVAAFAAVWVWHKFTGKALA